jgi:hypothetical protein
LNRKLSRLFERKNFGWDVTFSQSVMIISRTGGGIDISINQPILQPVGCCDFESEGIDPDSAPKEEGRLPLRREQNHQGFRGDSVCSLALGAVGFIFHSA